MVRLVAAFASAAMLSALASTIAATASGADSASCERLSSLRLAGATVTLAQAVDAGAFTPPDAAPEARRAAALPAFCRVAATLRPTSDSDIKIEVWMPVSNWNGKFQAVGNGAFSGSIAYPSMSTALARGYATSSTDTGHSGNTASFAAGHPEKVIDFGWRAVHQMTLAGRQIITAYYDAAPAHSYWNGCSAGG